MERTNYPAIQKRANYFHIGHFINVAALRCNVTFQKFEVNKHNRVVPEHC